MAEQRLFVRIKGFGRGRKIRIVRAIYRAKLSFRRRMGLPIIHVIGDSHVRAFQNHSPFKCHWIGPTTAHGLANPQSKTGSKEKLMKELGEIDMVRDLVLLSFGEIDARIHVYNNFMKDPEHRTLESVIDESIERYEKTVEEINARGIRTVILGIPPASGEVNIYKYPFYGTPEERATINRLFNQRLMERCRKTGQPAIDILSYISDSAGHIKEEFQLDDVHLNDSIVPYVKSFIYSHNKTVAVSPSQR